MDSAVQKARISGFSIYICIQRFIIRLIMEIEIEEKTTTTQQRLHSQLTRQLCLSANTSHIKFDKLKHLCILGITANTLSSKCFIWGVIVTISCFLGR